MAVDAELFYGKRKSEKPIFEINIEKYGILKRLKRFDQSVSQGVKKRSFYKQHEALSHYAQLIEIDSDVKADTDVEAEEGASRSRNAYSNGQGIIIYTEEIENAKRCFVLDSLYHFLKFYCFYALSLEDIYFDDGGISDGKANKMPLCKSSSCKSSPCKSSPNKALTGGPPPNDQPMHLYELILTNEKRWLFFDLEYDVLNGHQNKDCVLFIFLIELCLFVYANFDVKICLNDAIILDSSTSEKISFHVIVKNIHSLQDDDNYYEYLKDYCYFFQNRLNKSGDFFYDKYKKRQTKLNAQMKQKKLLLFDNENCIKYFVDLFINYIAEAIQENEDACVINLSTVYIRREKESPLLSEDNANFSSLEHSKVRDKTNDTHDESITSGKDNTTCCNSKGSSPNLSEPHGDHHKGTSLNPDSQDERSEPSEHPVEEKTPFDLINDFSEIHDLLMAINEGQIPANDMRPAIGGIIPGDQSNTLCGMAPTREGNKESNAKEKKKNSSYFSMYTKSLNDIVESYVNKLENAKGNNCFDRADENFLILLFAMKREESVDKSLEESIFHMDKKNGESNPQKDTPGVVDTECITPCEERKIHVHVQKEEIFQMDKKKNGDQEMVLLKCIVDNSVYSRNRNFRMIFSSKKKKKNNKKLMLSRYNVKRYSKANVDHLILKSLVTFYQEDDVNCQIGEDVIFKRDHMNKFKESHGHLLGQMNNPMCASPHFTFSRFSNGNAKRPRKETTFTSTDLYVHRSIQMDDINHAHVHTILKIIFFWNFELYKSFKKNKIYLDKFQGEISKEYFYRIVSIHNKLQYDLYSHDTSDGQAATSEEYSSMEMALTHEIDKRNSTSKDIQKDGHVFPFRKGITTPQFSKNLDTYDHLFLKNAQFYSYVLDEYTKCTQIKKEKNFSLLLLIKYFISSITCNTEEYILHFRENKFCKNKNRAHKSNHIYIVFNHLKNLFVQKCHDSECSHFVSEIYYL
ncbi:conserved Plasmodium protein, unknown function [Plasmodium knowlesi strain H]|uniref:DNA-directed primase/polymerase protein n=3 Tax=Plasmodium knowlesi TaxID=5850 RepID=A0A5K1UDS6_PLAKH|nr:conserved Plasmodium protein, unknown function [Plasmodium knowlesi strain H]OTN67760.1 Uncharacterized protein PKNOH_S05396700 [Plasmodium knowlesi]CAA9990554.1 conserved Plasmodium protein, unknown function [Plasmodium knowlesi strain H]SBO19812.1 conserved Plasmodium protein, unknown function [Plasmodium knowlesi strain H]SBO22370.1 conserved Plasmodium protein, unknown function [Plasmodium knowlesi strain H]VVS80028.1 conserved Plasmodium protein, unknown function [Plasmodium knowlesi s|eukprot:XP_002260939.1 hypothetical protein, conserved in Plasmodium species [Plasmodium knowlesi strain H]